MCRKLIFLTSVALVLALAGTNVAFGDVIERRVAASDDDAEEHVLEAGAMEGFTSSDLELGYEKLPPEGALQTVGIRLLDIQIPQGATITSAWVQFDADDVDNDRHVLAVSVLIEGEMSPNPVAFTDNAGDITSRLVTTASVVWDIPQWMEKHLQGPGEQTPDISAVIQEIVDQPDWVSGNAIVLLFRDNPYNPSAGTREAESFDGAPEAAPLLIIEFVEAAAPPEPEPAPPEPEPAPPTPVVVERRVAASSDDAEEHVLEGNWMESLTSSDLELAWEGGTSLQTVGIRLLDIQVPHGATITSAWVQFDADDIDNDYHALDVSLVIEGEGSPNAATFSENAGDITSRLVTTASVVWDVPQWMVKHGQGPEEQTPDISAVIQEIVDQPDWVSGNALVLLFRDNPDKPSVGCREAESFDGTADAAPLLHIEYTELPAPPTPPEAADGLMAYWNLDGDLTDASGNGLDGVLVDPCDPGSGAVPVFVAGIAGQALQLQVPVDWRHVEIPGTEDLFNVNDGAGMTVSAWVNTTNTAATGCAVSKQLIERDEAGTTSFNDGWVLNVNKKGFTIFGLKSEDNKDSRVLVNTPVVNDGEWHMLTGTYDTAATEIKVYIDGQLAGQHVHTIALNMSNALVRLGAASISVNSQYDGLLDEIMIWNYPLTDVEVLDAQSTVLTPTPPEPEPAPPEPEPAPPEPEPEPPTPGLVERRIAAGSDDAEENLDDLGEMELDSSDLELAWEGWLQDNKQVVGLRFTDITIPKGAKIKKAWVQFEVDETKGGTYPVYLIIDGELSANAATFSKADRDISSRPRTISGEWWDVPSWDVKGEQGSAQKTPDIADIIQEIVNQDGWASGNSLVLIFEQGYSRYISTGVRCAESFEGKAEAAPLLHIDVAQ